VTLSPVERPCAALQVIVSPLTPVFASKVQVLEPTSCSLAEVAAGGPTVIGFSFVWSWIVKSSILWT
jgi:hypothetical protein